jgi:hypothetical protein
MEHRAVAGRDGRHGRYRGQHADRRVLAQGHGRLVTGERPRQNTPTDQQARAAVVVDHHPVGQRSGRCPAGALAPGARVDPLGVQLGIHLAGPGLLGQPARHPPRLGKREVRRTAAVSARPVPGWCAGAGSAGRPARRATGHPSRRPGAARPARAPPATPRRTRGTPDGGSIRTAGARRRAPSPRPGRTAPSSVPAASGRGGGRASPGRSRSTASTASARCPACGLGRGGSRGCPSASRARAPPRSRPSA